MTITAIDKAIQEIMGSNLTTYRKWCVRKACLAYVLKVTSFQQFTNALKDISSPEQRRNLRNILVSRFEIVVATKQCVLLCVQKRATKEEARTIFKRGGLSISDAKLYFQLPRMALENKVREKVSGLISIATPEEVRKACFTSLERVEPYIKGFVHRKLRFLCTSNNINPMDFINDLKEKAVKAFYFSVPYIPELHLENTMRNAAHNFGINLIDFYTSQRRCRLQSDGKGSFYNTIQTDTMMTEEGESINYAAEFQPQTILDHQDMLETRMSIRSLMNKLSSKRKRVVELLLRKDDPKFVDYFNSEYASRRVNSVDDAYKQVGRKTFLEALRYFVGLSKKRFQRFISELQDMFQWKPAY